MQPILEQLKNRFSAALSATFGEEYAHIDPIVVQASNPKFGDYQCNVSLSLSKSLQQKPRDIAQALIDHLAIADICETPTIAGPGFINLTLKTDYLTSLLREVQQSDRLGVALTENPQRIIVDFSSPNIAKEMHVGHLRSTIIGDSIARILEFCGQDVLRLNHVGDWGTQFGMLIIYLKEAFPDALTKADALDIGDLVSFYKQAKIRFDEDEDFKERARQQVVKLQSGDSESLTAWQLLCEQSRREFQLIYDTLNIRLTERGESFYNPYLADVVTALKEANLLEESEGAQCVFLEGFSNKDGDRQPLIVQKTNGGYNYATTDLAAIRYRVQTDGAKRIIYVTDSGQESHFAQVFQVAQRASFVPEDVQLVHVPFGLVQGEDGKKLKTRSGETIKLKELLDEAVNRCREDLENRLETEARQETSEFVETVAKTVGIAAVKYADLSQNRTSNYIFSFNKMLALQGNTAPYMLYAYVRVQGVSRQGEINFKTLSTETPLILQDETELILAKHILQLSEVLTEVERDLLPNRLCDYLYELSRKFNKFYESCPILKAEGNIRTSRLILADITARTLRLGLSLLGISVLDRM